VGFDYIVAIGNASPPIVHWSKQCMAALCLTIAFAMVAPIKAAAGPDAKAIT
jgi:hypothetical protein